MGRGQCRGLRAGDLILVSGERWAKVLRVPFGFPWLSATVETESGWPIHRDHITDIQRQPVRRKEAI